MPEKQRYRTVFNGKKMVFRAVKSVTGGTVAIQEVKRPDPVPVASVAQESKEAKAAKRRAMFAEIARRL